MRTHSTTTLIRGKGKEKGNKILGLIRGKGGNGTIPIGAQGGQGPHHKGCGWESSFAHKAVGNKMIKFMLSSIQAILPYA